MPNDQFSYIHQYFVESLQIMDNIPINILYVCEDRIRRTWKFNVMHSKKAVVTQNRFDKLNRQIQHQLIQNSIRRVHAPIKK